MDNPDFRTPLQRRLGPFVEKWGPVALVGIAVLLGLTYAALRLAVIIKVLSWEGAP